MFREDPTLNLKLLTSKAFLTFLDSRVKQIPIDHFIPTVQFKLYELERDLKKKAIL